MPQPQLNSSADVVPASPKVLLITAAFPPMKTGGGDYVMRFAREIKKIGWDVTILTSNIPGVQNDPDFRVLPLMTTWEWRGLITILKIIKELRPDVVNLHFAAWTFKQHPMISFVPEIIRRWQPQTVIVTQIETATGLRKGMTSRISYYVQRILKAWSGKRYTNYGYGTILRSSHRIVTQSTGQFRIISEEHPELGEKVVLAPPPPIMPMVPASQTSACRQKVREELGMAEEEVLIAYYGYLYPKKGVETLFSSFNILCSKGLNAKLILVGDTPDDDALRQARRPKYKEELLEIVSAMALQERIVCTGYLESNSDLASRFLRAADVVCLPFDTGIQLHRSSFNFAAAHGTPIVSTGGPDTEDVFVDGENVILCPPEDAPAIAHAIETVLEDRDLREQLCRGALKLSAEWFDWEVTVSKTLAAYNNEQVSTAFPAVLQT